jgi:prolyl 4-hydroxylase
MTINCAPVCQSCDKLHVATRCPLDPSAPNALERPGDLNALFERIVSEPYFHEQYGITVLSRPDYAPGDGPDSRNITYHVGGSWVIQFDRAVADHEADRLIELGTAQGYERSADVGAEKEDGTHENYVNEGRTSTNAWCLDDCMADPIALNVTQRIANITGILETNFENFQLLRYGEHQFYNVHNDFIDYQVDRPCGSRLLTFYMYLNDVESGGGTNFPILNLTVLPKKGRAVLWPSVLDSDPFAKDPQSDHQALPVLEGIKYGANVWLHQRDFQNANRIGCA